MNIMNYYMHMCIFMSIYVIPETMFKGLSSEGYGCEHPTPQDFELTNCKSLHPSRSVDSIRLGLQPAGSELVPYTGHLYQGLLTSEAHACTIENGDTCRSRPLFAEFRLLQL